MPSTTDTPPSHWLLAAATVAAAHTGVLYALWTGPSANDLALPAGQPSFTEVQVVPTVPVAAAPTQPPAVTRPARRTPPTAPPSPTTDTTPATESEPPPGAEFPPPSAEAEAPAPASVPPAELMARADPAPEPAARSAEAIHLVTPPSAQWLYEVRGESKGLNYTAHATLDWRQDNQRYEARMEVRVFLIGSRVQTSTGTLGPLGLQPDQFVDRARKEKRLRFDHDAQLIRLEGSDSTAPLAEGVQDRLSLFMQLSSLLAALPAPPTPGTQWSFWVAGSPTADTWTLRYVKNETLQLPAGRFEAWHLQRLPRSDNDQQVDLWFAPSLHHLPVRIRIQQDNGDVLDQLLATPPQ